jgi:hypothetical protein
MAGNLSQFRSLGQRFAHIASRKIEKSDYINAID